MSKYDPLSTFLAAQKQRECRLRFAEIEKLLGFSLPPSSKTHRAWWSNNPSNNVMTKAWLIVGWETERVDMESETLVFVRRRQAASSEDTEAEASQAQSGPKRVVNVFGTLKGTVTISGDILSPIDVEWDAQEGRL